MNSRKFSIIGCVDDIPYLYIGGSISVLKEDKGMYKAIYDCLREIAINQHVMFVQFYWLV